MPGLRCYEHRSVLFKLWLRKTGDNTGTNRYAGSHADTERSCRQYLYTGADLYTPAGNNGVPGCIRVAGTIGNPMAFLYAGSHVQSDADTDRAGYHLRENDGDDR